MAIWLQIGDGSLFGRTPGRVVIGPRMLKGTRQPAGIEQTWQFSGTVFQLEFGEAPYPRTS